MGNPTLQLTWEASRLWVWGVPKALASAPYLCGVLSPSDLRRGVLETLRNEFTITKVEKRIQEPVTFQKFPLFTKRKIS